MAVSGTQGSAGADEGAAGGGELFDRASALSREWAAADQAARERRAADPFPSLPDTAATERMLRELVEAERAVGEVERRALRMARGALLAVRHLAGGGVDPDRERAEALVLLREARSAVPVTEREVRSREAVVRLLIRLLMPRLPELEGQGQRDFTEIMKVGAAYLAPGGSGSRADIAEVASLLEELAETADPVDRPDLERWIASLRMISGMTNDRASLLDVLARANTLGTMPPQISLAMNAVAELLKGMPDTPAGPAQETQVTPAGPAQETQGTSVGPVQETQGTSPGPAPETQGTSPGPAPETQGTSPGPAQETQGTSPGPAPETQGTSPGPAPETQGTSPGPAQEMPGTSPEELARFAQEWLPAMELMSPGLLKPEEFERAAEALPVGTWQEQMTAGLIRMAIAMRDGTAEGLVEAGEPLLDAARSADAPAGLSPILLAGLLSSASMQGGNLLDEATAHQLLTGLFGKGDTTGDSLPGPAGKELSTSGRALLLHQRISAAADDDLDELDEIAEILLDMRQDLADDDSVASLVLFNLGTVQLRRAMAIGNAGGTVGPPLRRALMYLREAQEHPAMPMALRGVMASMGAVTSALEQYVDPSSRGVLEEVERARAALGGTVVLADQDIRARLGIALALNVQHERHGDPAALDGALRELEAARAEIGDHTGGGTAQEVYKELAGLYRRRKGPGDTARALEATERQLEKVAEDVLLQIGAEHGLAAARAAADRGVTAAVWAAEADDAVTALRVLEAGRALVLRAVAASASVPEQLEAYGEHELAVRWREAARAGDGADGPRTSADTPDTPDTLIPSTLRRRALAALRTHAIGGPEEQVSPGGGGWQEVADAAQRGGVDAVVHLLVGQGDGAGRALVVRPGLAPLPLELGGLGRAERGPLERYLDAARDRSAFTAPGVPRDAPGRAEAEAAWQGALEEVCDWAGPAVMGPVLDVVRPGRPARPVDPVRLVLLPAGNLGSVPWHAARVAAGAGERPVYAVDLAVISHAASEAEFLRSVGRARLPVAADPVLVADPRFSLPYAEHEIDGVRESFYPHARCHGYLARNLWKVDGTPDELLPLLPGGTAERPATLVQLSVHGRVGDRPTVSRLLLHPPRPGEGDGDDPGALTVRQLLGAPSAGGRNAAGPLVVLSACETDFSSRDHDEALTLTTAFVARGAADVIGSKWGVDDASSAVLMYVVHHHLAQGADPAQALRLTQLWALDPARTLFPGFHGPLAARIRGKGALPVAAWAPFIHQGNPTPATGPTRREHVGHQ
ncbi:CHAT domain-containing protein [Streptomyces sp. NPDC096132]|uniref:CHAT domain-containing protein n=1 Tax=Streptomyces sp. NPDC096132 TaxID=3366075 RepID=UPI00380EFFFE